MENEDHALIVVVVVLYFAPVDMCAMCMVTSLFQIKGVFTNKSLITRRSSIEMNDVRAGCSITWYSVERRKSNGRIRNVRRDQSCSRFKQRYILHIYTHFPSLS